MNRASGSLPLGRSSAGRLPARCVFPWQSLSAINCLRLVAAMVCFCVSSRRLCHACLGMKCPAERPPAGVRRKRHRGGRRGLWRWSVRACRRRTSRVRAGIVTARVRVRRTRRWPASSGAPRAAGGTTTSQGAASQRGRWPATTVKSGPAGSPRGERRAGPRPMSGGPGCCGRRDAGPVDLMAVDIDGCGDRGPRRSTRSDPISTDVGRARGGRDGSGAGP